MVDEPNPERLGPRQWASIVTRGVVLAPVILIVLGALLAVVLIPVIGHPRQLVEGADHPLIAESLVSYVRFVELKGVDDDKSNRIVADVIDRYGEQYRQAFGLADESKLAGYEWGVTMESLTKQIGAAPADSDINDVCHRVLLRLLERNYDVYNPRDQALLADTDALAVACMNCIAGKAPEYDANVRRYAMARAQLSTFHGEEMRAILKRLDAAAAETPS